MSRVFADTFYFIALLSPDDDAHVEAVEYSQLIDRLVTTEWVLLELADGLAATPARSCLAATHEALEADGLAEIVPLDMALQREALDLYFSRPDKEWSLTDCVSFIVMQRLRIFDALTGDHHFEQAGFRALFKPRADLAGRN